MVIIVIIGIIVIFVLLSKANGGKFSQVANNHSSYQSDDYSDESSEASLPEPAANLNEKITEIKSRDPQFNEQMFEDRVSTAFFKIQEAWCSAEMNLARAFVTDGVLRRFNMQLEEYRKNNTRNKLE